MQPSGQSIECIVAHPQHGFGGHRKPDDSGGKAGRRRGIGLARGEYLVQRPAREPAAEHHVGSTERDSGSLDRGRVDGQADSHAGNRAPP
jgi:hypothetical protein